MTKHQNRYSATAVDGQLAAASTLGRTSMRPDVTEVINDYKRLTSEEARAAFADHFLSRTAGMMEEIWPAFYELLKHIKEGELYKKPGYLVTDRQFDSFKEYWEYRVGPPYDTWFELESLYRYAATYKRELLKMAFGPARNAMRVALALTPVKDRINDADGGPIPKTNLDIIQVSVDGGGGTRADYLARRIARDHPDILERMAAGEFRSVHKAAREAGIAPRTQTIRMDDAESAARALRKHMTPEVLASLVELLTKPDGPDEG